MKNRETQPGSGALSGWRKHEIHRRFHRRRFRRYFLITMAKATRWEGWKRKRGEVRREGGQRDGYSAKDEGARENRFRSDRLSHGKDFPGKSLSQSGRITDAWGKWAGNTEGNYVRRWWWIEINNNRDQCRDDWISLRIIWLFFFSSFLASIGENLFFWSTIVNVALFFANERHVEKNRHFFHL